MDIADATSSIVKLCNCSVSGYSSINIAYNGIYSISRFVSYCEKIFDRKLNYSVNHPDFEFDLIRARNKNVLPENSFCNAILTFKEQLEFYEKRNI